VETLADETARLSAATNDDNIAPDRKRAILHRTTFTRGYYYMQAYSLVPKMPNAKWKTNIEQSLQRYTLAACSSGYR